MLKKVNRMEIGILIVAVILISWLSVVLAVDLASIIEEAKARYAKFDKDVKDMTIVQETKTVSPEGKGITLETKIFRKGEKFRFEIPMPMPETAQMPKGMGPMVSIILYDGKNIYMFAPFMGKKTLSGEEEKQYQKEKNWWDWLSERAKVVGTEKINGRECYVIEVRDEKEVLLTKMWLDKKTLSFIKSETAVEKGKKVLSISSDFRKIKGDWEMPYKFETFEDSKLLTSSIIKSVAINKGLSDDLFNPDKVEVKGFDMQEMMKMMQQQQEEQPQEEEPAEEEPVEEE